jgi:predicted Rossmann fold nucleotide-binding protein DprA/Smf involved in DNA uptake
MSGTPRREDAAFWVIKISKNHNGNDKRKGAFFTTSFEKNREDAGGMERNLDWSFVTESGRTQVTYAPTDMRARIYDLIRDGMDSCSDIAEYLGVTKGSVSQFATQLIADGLIKKQGNLYVIA